MPIVNAISFPPIFSFELRSAFFLCTTHLFLSLCNKALQQTTREIKQNRQLSGVGMNASMSLVGRSHRIWTADVHVDLSTSDCITYI
jgi:hypothetical protein